MSGSGRPSAPAYRLNNVCFSTGIIIKNKILSERLVYNSANIAAAILRIALQLFNPIKNILDFLFNVFPA